MSVLYIVRHGQASFFSHDYDRLSEKGYKQAQRLGEYWRENQIEIDEVYSGSLKRQLQTAEACGGSYAISGNRWPETQILEGLNEYHADEVMEKLKPELVENHSPVRKLYNEYENATEERERYRTFHRLLEAVMEHYIAGEYESTGFETWRAFHSRVTGAYQAIRDRQGRGRNIAVFTSGGPVGVAIQTCLRAPEQEAAHVNWRVYNASITRFTFSATRISLDQFNTIPHLPKELLTYR